MNLGHSRLSSKDDSSPSVQSQSQSPRPLSKLNDDTNPSKEYSSSYSSPLAKLASPSVLKPEVLPENQLYAFQTLLFSYQAGGVELTPPVMIDTTTNTVDTNGNIISYYNNNIDLTKASTMSILEPSHTTVSDTKVSQSGARVKGTMTLAYMACQMLPDPMHLRVVTMILPCPTPSSFSPGSTTSTTTMSKKRSAATDSVLQQQLPPQQGSTAFAIEYFEDEDCEKFLMATSGPKVNLREDEGKKEWAKAGDALSGTTNTTTTLQDPPKSNSSQNRDPRVVSIRWVGLALHEGQIRTESLEDEGEKEVETEIEDENNNGKESQKENEQVDDTTIDQDDNNNDGEDEEHEGYLSWEPFLSSQLQPPPSTIVGIIPPPPPPTQSTTANFTTPAMAATGTTTKTTPTMMSHGTSQMVMAGLVAGLFLFMGSLLMAVYYRQTRQKWYEEDGVV